MHSVQSLNVMEVATDLFFRIVRYIRVKLIVRKEKKKYMAGLGCSWLEERDAI